MSTSLLRRWVYKNPKKRAVAAAEDPDGEGGDGRTRGGSLMQRGRLGGAETGPAINSEEWLKMHSDGGVATGVDPADEFFFRFFSNKARGEAGFVVGRFLREEAGFVCF